MNVGFFIDKSQTAQSILGLIRECKKRGHTCDVFSTCERESLANIPKIGIDLDDVGWGTFSSRDKVKKAVMANCDKYHCLIGINLFNTIWRKIYETTNLSNVYAVEYCWNEIYNNRSDYSGFSTLFANSEWSKQTIESLTGYSKIQSLGSPWFEIISDFRKLRIKEEGKIITFMAPHNSFVSNYKGFLDYAKFFLNELRSFCDRNGYLLILKSRKKYSYPYHKFTNFDGYVYDDNIVSHLRLYASSKCVFNFCSSAINELAFLETPYVCLFPDLHADLHRKRDNLVRAMKPINERYYSGDIFDGVHCTSILRGHESDEAEFTMRIRNELDRTLSLIEKDDRDWKSFQREYFPGDHSNASSRIFDFIEKECKIGM